MDKDNNEKILVVSGVNEADLLRTLCYFGKESFGLRVMSAAELAERALISGGKLIPERRITAGQQTMYMTRALERCNDKYFPHDHESVTKLTASLNMLRLLIPADERGTLAEKLPQNEAFAEKNNALAAVYDEYIRLCEGGGVIDGVSLLRRAAEIAPKLENTDILLLEEYPPQPAERTLIEAVADKMTTVSLGGFFGAERSAAPAAPEIFAARGAYNEVLAILDNILGGDIGFDRCTVAVTDTSVYPQLFFTLGLRFGIKMTFGCGIPFANSTAARFLKRLAFRNGAGRQNRRALNDLVFCGVFDSEKLCERVCGGDDALLRKVLALAGDMRLGLRQAVNSERIARLKEMSADDEDTLRLIEPLEKLAAELERGALYLLKEYCTRRKNALAPFDSAALREAVAAMEDHSRAAGGDPLDTLPALMRRNVCRMAREAGALHIVSVDRAAFSLRDKLFIAGLSADLFPGKPVEDPIALDSDIALIDGSADAPLSENVVRRKTYLVEALGSLARALGSEIVLSYSCLRAAELKQANMSAAAAELFNSLAGKESSPVSYGELCRRCEEENLRGYFSDGFGADRLIGRRFAAGEATLPTAKAPDETAAVSCFDDREYSPSELDTFFECPRKYFFNRVLGIKEKESIHDFTVIEANEQGTLFHSAMESLAASGMKMTKEEFLETLGLEFDRFLARKVPLLPSSVDGVRDSLSGLASSAYDDDTAVKKEIVAAEKKLRITHKPSGVKLYGLPDRVERSEDGCLVADFKTGAKIKQDDAQPKTFVQTMCYAYMMNNSDTPVNVTKCEYRYPKTAERTKSREYSPRELEEILAEFVGCLKAGRFPAATGKEDDIAIINNGSGGKPAVCGFCKFKSICGETKEGE
ncbi:MAG: PD-(D/E)XK nuclease family protein [Ruminococcus sp.]|nr:PD-(D/E)XK nuclease family protein [Ruminococcus sp.]